MENEGTFGGDGNVPLWMASCIGKTHQLYFRKEWILVYARLYLNKPEF